METKKVLTRENILTEEISAIVTKLYKGIKLEYTEVFYLDNVVDEDTGMINKDLKDKHYTKNQMSRNLKALKNDLYFNSKMIARIKASQQQIKDGEGIVVKTKEELNTFFNGL